MPDDNSYGGFTNPGFVTPEQIAQNRQIITQLLAGAYAPDTSKHWTGALAQGLMGLRGGNLMNQTNQMQRQGLQLGADAQNQAMGANPFAAILGGQNPTSPQASNAATSGDNVPRGIRNNNPGNIKDGPFAQSMPGYAGSDGTFARFSSPDAGAKAMDSLLATYGNKGINTVSGVVNRWAPPSENNSTAYASTVAKQLGVDPNTPINMGDSAIRQQLAGGITGYENGQRYAPQGGQQVAQNGGGNLANFYQNPWVPKELKERVMQGNTPVPVEDVTGRPAVRQGVMGPSVGLPTQNFTPGFRAPATVGPDGGISTTIVNPAPGAGSSPSTGQQMDKMFQQGQGFAQEAAVNKAKREGLAGDVGGAMLAPQTKQILNTMKSDIIAHGDKMVFSPTADWINNLRRSVAQHAPGLLSENDLAGLASADSFDKLSAQLQSIVGRQVGGTDASLMQGMRSVPGQHNSKEGALALIDMLNQVTEQQENLISKHRYDFGKIGPDGKPFDFLAAKQKYFDEHPITNPLTKKPLREGMSGGNLKMLNGKQYQKLNGIWHEVM